MKVDFKGKGMTINFDKVPRFIYFNEEGNGVGQVYFDGVRRTGLQKVKIEAGTADGRGWPPLKYKIQYIEKNTNGEPLFISNIQEAKALSLTLKLDITDSEVMLDCIKDILNDQRISEETREEYAEKFVKAIKNAVIVRTGDNQIAAIFKEEE